MVTAQVENIFPHSRMLALWAKADFIHIIHIFRWITTLFSPLKMPYFDGSSILSTLSTLSTRHRVDNVAILNLTWLCYNPLTRKDKIRQDSLQRSCLDSGFFLSVAASVFQAKDDPAAGGPAVRFRSPQVTDFLSAPMP